MNQERDTQIDDCLYTAQSLLERIRNLFDRPFYLISLLTESDALALDNGVPTLFSHAASALNVIIRSYNVSTYRTSILFNMCSTACNKQSVFFPSLKELPSPGCCREILELLLETDPSEEEGFNKKQLENREFV